MRTQKFHVRASNINSVISQIKELFDPEFEIQSHTGKTYVFSGESYSFMQDSDMATTLFLDINSAEDCTGIIIVSGGKQGFFRFDIFGRESNRVNGFLGRLKSFCDRKGYKFELS